ncbi:MAG TPA: archaetidylserine decarboxylase [Burkholderiales bacterium]|nr:archaetidylserine decarboxylase [Burkholderiales bacterium]
MSRIKALPQYLYPKRTLTELAARFAGARAGRWTTAVIRWFIGHYHVDMSEAVNPDPAAYATFNEFFTRALKPGARPLADADYVCPVDGAISQFGAIARDRIVQAKSHDYSTLALVGGDRELAASFDDGSFATLYLAPKDYHRVHMPCAGRLTRMIYVPGALFSVNPTTALGVPNLFARNERVVCVFETDHGPFVLTLVGATIVGSMETVWHGVVNPKRTGEVREWRYDPSQHVFAKGDEMGRFSLGSTVVLLFARRCALRFNPRWAPQGSVRMGETMANSGGS